MMAAAMLLMLAACGSPDDKAAKAAARFDMLYLQGDYAGAREQIGRALAMQDEIPEYWAKLARVELASGRYLDAYNAYNHVIELEPDNEDAIQAMAELSFAGGSLDEAEEKANQMIEKHPRLLRMLLVKGSVLAARREVQEARAVAEQMLQIDPNNEGAKLLLARVLNMGGDRAAAIALMEKSIAKDGETVQKLMVLLDLYSGNDDFKKTALTFARLFALQPRNIDLRLEYARVLYEHGKPQRALEMLIRLSRAHAADPDLPQRIVELWTDVGAAAVDVESVRRFVLSSGNDPMKVALGQLLIDGKRYAEAQAVLLPFIDRGDITAERVEADVLHAGALAGLGRNADADALIDRILKFDATNPRALLMRVRIRMARGDLVQALRDAQTLATDNPSLVEGRVALGDIYVRRKEMVLADSIFATAMKELSADPAMLKAYLAYLHMRGKDAIGIVTAKRFTRENPRLPGGWGLRGELCLQQGDDRCVDDSLHMLRQLPGGRKYLRPLEIAEAARPHKPADGKAPPVTLLVDPAVQGPPICGTTGAPC